MFVFYYYYIIGLVHVNYLIWILSEFFPDNNTNYCLYEICKSNVGLKRQTQP